MTDKLIEQIKVDRYVSSLWANDRRRARLVEYEDRILADAKVIESAKELAEAAEGVGVVLPRRKQPVQDLMAALANFNEAMKGEE